VLGFRRSTAVSTLLQLLAPGHLRRRVMSVNTLAWQGLEYVGVLITGARHLHKTWLAFKADDLAARTDTL
jgi:hypothetical protein